MQDHPTTETIRCRVCKQEKAPSEFFVHRNTRTGRKTECKVCAKQLWETYLQQRRDGTYQPTRKGSAPSMQSDSKLCSRCKQVKILDEFWNHRKSGDGKNSRCKACEAIAARQAAERWKLAPGIYREKKYCCRCKQIKLRSEFGACRGQKDGLYNLCHECSRDYGRERRLKLVYGITEEQYLRLLTKQQGACAICGRLLNQRATRQPAVDHHHATGKVRGLLCHLCNLSLGWMEEADRLQKAVAYLDAARRSNVTRSNS